jgi:putative FmdB family regulatory protein
MPIYAYRCSACGHAQDHLQKISDDPLHTCPACGVAAYAKQVTAAGFQLKGSGWYVTDFRGGNNAGAAKKDDAGDKPAEKAAADAGQADGKPADPAATKASDKTSDKPAAAPAATPVAPAAGAD